MCSKNTGSAGHTCTSTNIRTRTVPSTCWRSCLPAGTGTSASWATTPRASTLFEAPTSPTSFLSAAIIRKPLLCGWSRITALPVVSSAWPIPSLNTTGTASKRNSGRKTPRGIPSCSWRRYRNGTRRRKSSGRSGACKPGSDTATSILQCSTGPMRKAARSRMRYAAEAFRIAS